MMSLFQEDCHTEPVFVTVPIPFTYNCRKRLLTNIKHPSFKYALFIGKRRFAATGVVPCVGPKSLPVHHPLCRLYFTFGPLR